MAPTSVSQRGDGRGGREAAPGRRGRVYASIRGCAPGGCGGVDAQMGARLSQSTESMSCGL
eukprot:10101872-Alexandrium_andersonii.AAC.1